ncbi:anti-sigma regulatory factor (Ser/Thr protein kinase) [Hydrogenoanaerobacterium saccharovorans]|uniref:Anti-sigma regulatory factor (Ser/Thr protein kinase) n=1 Tax=Hydrogenoanaerobacterium saccharovorans TaxID=474960 RepID=A0A1H8CGN8_9FIRM|nr:anti-sigma regulatory factor [Hydrogenoanaerobacterium saccharovorans]RPF43095.1 anti-sigma regulatory factor (Ser/Thr protein kinase) [Hydrogenoanaerobacterium saccharovorans]SEM94132.1 Anti-sigma regulatory factor (Ser/Thr protein kinase) [Hydrogenoanaerobacterium saccharovorans]
MTQALTFEYTVPGDDFTRAGEASSSIKKMLKQIGLAPEVIRKVAIAVYEGEINMVIHAGGGEITVNVTSDEVSMTLTDKGPGIADISLAMREGWSTAPDDVRSLGFGAGMGLPNMKKYTDEMTIESTLGVGTTVKMRVYVKQ